MTLQQNDITISNDASREQLEEIYDLLGEVFTIGRAYFQTRLDFDSTYHPSTTWFATVHDRIASTVQIFPLYIRVGQAVLKIGGMGSVATHPDFRGMGLAPQILNAQSEWMKQNGYDLSLLLASKFAFYEKVGWRLIPEHVYSMQAPNASIKGGNNEVIPFEPQYLDDLRSIYEQFNDKRTYTVVRNESYWDDVMQWPDWKQADCLLLRKDQKIIAYGIIERNNNEQVYINEFVYLEEAGDSIIDLYIALCQLRPHAKHILARLPEDHKLVPYFQEHAGIKSELNMSMWKCINYEAMFIKLLPELQMRLNQSKQYSTKDLHIALHCNGESIYLCYENQTLSILSNKHKAIDYLSITIEDRELISSIIFGYTGSTDNEEKLALLQLLFPKQNAVFYMTDKF